VALGIEDSDAGTAGSDLDDVEALEPGCLSASDRATHPTLAASPALGTTGAIVVAEESFGHLSARGCGGGESPNRRSNGGPFRAGCSQRGRGILGQ
jgi:hypothetical protein